MSAADGGGGGAARDLSLDASREATAGLHGAIKRVHLRVVGREAREERDPLDVKTPRGRPYSISVKRLSKRELERGRLMYPEAEYDRPKTRGDCLHGPHAERPCPFVSCKHHLYLDVNKDTGSIKMNFPDLEVWELTETCALDIADRGGVTLEEVGALTSRTRGRIQQVETRAIAKLRALADISAVEAWIERDRFREKRALDAYVRSRRVGGAYFDEPPAEHGVAGDVSGIVSSHDHGSDLLHDGALGSLGL